MPIPMNDQVFCPLRVSDVTNVAWHGSDFSSESVGVSFSSRVRLLVWAAKSFVPRPAKSLSTRLLPDERVARNKKAQWIKSANLGLSQLAQKEKLPWRRVMNDAASIHKHTQINAKSLPLEAVQFWRLAANFQKNSGAHHFAVEALQDKKKWYCGTMIPLCGEPRQKQTLSTE